MLNYKPILLRIVLLLFLFHISYFANGRNNPAQNNTNIGLQLGNFVSPQFYNRGTFSRPIKVLGISASEALYKNFGIKFGYQFWIDPFGANVYGKPFEMVISDKDADIRSRANYQIFDLGCMYRKGSTRHQVFGDMAISFASGENEVITGIYQQPGYPDRLIEMELQKAKYTGLKCELGYNYLLFKNRMNAGVSVSSRNYFGKDAFTQYNLNVNFGYNFNLIKRKQTDCND